MNRKELILATAADAALNFMYYDRKQDEELPSGEIESAVESGEITYQEIADHFFSWLEKS